eukprot:UN01000
MSLNISSAILFNEFVPKRLCLEPEKELEGECNVWLTLLFVLVGVMCGFRGFSLFFDNGRCHRYDRYSISTCGISVFCRFCTFCSSFTTLLGIICAHCFINYCFNKFVIQNVPQITFIRVVLAMLRFD